MSANLEVNVTLALDLLIEILMIDLKKRRQHIFKDDLLKSAYF